MKRAVVIATMLAAAALGGCATSLETNTSTFSDDNAASPPTSPGQTPGNVFIAPPGFHYHGTMGP